DRIQENELLIEASAWSFIHFLLHGDVLKGKDFLLETIRKVREGGDARSALPTLLQAGTLDELNDRWRWYIGRMK
ncbi:MAG: hypothetical protein DMF49_12455, partial [Acidobacteria bacterium]